MSPCRPDYIIIPKDALRFEPLGPTPFRDSRYTFQVLNFLMSYIVGMLTP